MPTILEEFSKQYGITKTQGTYGIEIEVEGVLSIDSLPKGWTAKGDGSLRENGIEYLFRRPQSKTQARRMVISLKEYLNKTSTIRETDRAGVHVHLNCQQYTKEQVFMLSFLYYIFETALIKWAGPSREGNLFCLRVGDAEDIITELHTAYIENNFTPLLVRQYRYASLNFTSLSRFGSLEFRGMCTPMDFSRINTWVEMIDRLKIMSLSYKTPEELVNDVSFLGPDAFSRKIFGKLYRNLLYKEFEEDVYNNVRIMQEFIYYTVLRKRYKTEGKKEKKKTSNFAQPRIRRNALEWTAEETAVAHLRDHAFYEQAALAETAVVGAGRFHNDFIIDDVLPPASLRDMLSGITRFYRNNRGEWLIERHQIPLFFSNLNYFSSIGFIKDITLELIEDRPETLGPEDTVLMFIPYTRTLMNCLLFHRQNHNNSTESYNLLHRSPFLTQREKVNIQNRRNAIDRDFYQGYRGRTLPLRRHALRHGDGEAEPE